MSEWHDQSQPVAKSYGDYHRQSEQAARAMERTRAVGPVNGYFGGEACDAAPVTPIGGAVSSLVNSQKRMYGLLDSLEAGLAMVTREVDVPTEREHKREMPQSALHGELLALVDGSVAIERRIESILNRLTV